MTTSKIIVRATYGALAGLLGAAGMTVIRMAARRRGIIEKTVPQAAEEWLAVRTGFGRGAHPAVHHVADQLMHLAYGAALAVPYGLTVRGRSHSTFRRGAGFGLVTWLLGSWIVMPALGAKRAVWRERLPGSAVDLLAHLAFGAATSLLAEELTVQANRGPSSDASRRASRVG